MKNKEPLLVRFRRWWDGEYRVDRTSRMPIIYFARSPWARRLDACGKWCARNGWNLSFAVLALLGVWLAYRALP